MPRGGVIGFVGPNGAGKSTTIRMILGLIKPTRGNAEILGHDLHNPSAYLGKVGALIEAPAFYPGLTASQNLRALAKLGGFREENVLAVLDTVGLAPRANDKVAHYSLGMKQRLGIATALLPDPELLILDEPTNGLDPAGIVEIRNLLMRIGESGKTVFVSSHLLSEVETIAQRLVILHNGGLVFAGELDDIMKNACHNIYAAPENDADLPFLVDIVKKTGYSFQKKDNGIYITAPNKWASELNRITSSQGIILREVRSHCESLEDIFLGMTSREAAR
jgi:ABC-2 type transport system ATP-binding protein